MAFPTSVDSFPTLVDNVDNILAQHPNNLSTAVVALETKVGADSSAVTGSHDYKLRNLPSQTGTSKVTNLNADLLDSIDSTGFYIANSGDVKMTSSATVDSGWTDVSATYNGYFIRISTGTALSTGGSDTHTHTGTTDAYSITQANLPSYNLTSTRLDGNGSGLTGIQGTNNGANSTSFNIASGGSGTAFTTTFTSASSSNVPVYVQLKMLKKT